MSTGLCIALRQKGKSGVQVLKVLHQHGRFVAAPVSMLEGWNQTTGVDLHELVWFLVRIDFNILIGEAFQFQRNPHSLDEGAA